MDVENDGLLDQTTKLHCLVLRCMETDRVVSCTDSAEGYTSIAEGLSLLSEAEKVYGHNCIRHDLPVLRKLRKDFRLRDDVRILDTYVACATRWAHIKDTDWARVRSGTLPVKLLGRHTLEAYGYRLGITKKGTEIEDWSEWTALMQSRCESDTAITKALAERIRAAGVSPESMETEHALCAYLHQQERNGWPFDLEGATTLQAQLAAKREALEQELREVFPPWRVSTGMFIPKRDDKKRGYQKGVAVERFKTMEFNPSSRPQIANRLQAVYDWKPTVFTEKGSPQVDANTLKGLTYPPIKKLREYLELDDFLGMLAEGKQAWLKHATNDRPEGGKLTGLYHIHGGVIQTGTITHRSAHVKPPLTQAPKVGNPFGAEGREKFMVPPGWVLIGSDASGLELRCLAHYLAKYDDGAYGRVLLEGDVHSITQQALIEWLEPLGPKKGRDTAKTWKYAWLYGAGPLKRGKILAPGKSEAEQKRIGEKSAEMFLKKIPALAYLQRDLKLQGKKGYLIAIDGRRVYVRSEHAYLNSLLQTTGSVICRRWCKEFNQEFMALFDTPPGGGWLYPWAAVGYFHDEFQLAAWNDSLVIDTMKSVLVDTIRSMTQHFNFLCPLDGEAKVGANWKETH